MPEERSLRMKKLIYWLDEMAILLIVIVSVIFADALVKRAQGKPAALGDVFLDPLNVIISALIAVMVYGGLYTKWKYNDADKPPVIKRAANAIAQGIAWRTLVGSVNN